MKRKKLQSSSLHIAIQEEIQRNKKLCLSVEKSVELFRLEQRKFLNEVDI